MNVSGGLMPTAELDNADVCAIALELLLHEEGTVTPYGVVCDNGMKLEPLYDGRHFPAYYYNSCLLGVAMSPKSEPTDTKNITWLYLPMSQTQIERAMCRAAIDTYDDMRLRFDENLIGYYDFEKYGQQRMAQEEGTFTDRGYISYHGTLSFDELLCGSQGERMDHIMGGMGGME